MSNSPNDNHFHAIEEKRHREHMEIRAARLHGDGTIEQEEAELARIRAIKHRRDVDALKAENAELRRQLAEVTPAAAEWENYCESQAQRHGVQS